jgi:hypothetical protein
MMQRAALLYLGCAEVCRAVTVRTFDRRQQVIPGLARARVPP